MFTVSKIGHIEDDSFRVCLQRTGRAIIVACTGNGGDTSYQLLESQACDPYFQQFRELGYASTHSEAERLAKYILKHN